MKLVKIEKAPCFGQTSESVKAWLRTNVAVGTEVAIRATMGGFVHYAIAKVNRIGKGRFQVDHLPPQHSGGNTFYYSGRNCFHPKGQTLVVIPTDEVRAAAAATNNGKNYFGDLWTFGERTIW